MNHDSSVFLSYLDQLREDPSNVTSVRISNSSSSRLLEVETAYSSNELLLRLAHVALFLPLTRQDGMIRQGSLNDAFGTFVAMEEWNKNQAQQQYQCNLRFSTSITDTKFDEIVATVALNEMLQGNNTLIDPTPAAVIGAYRSAVTVPLATLTGVQDVVQISHASTSNGLDVKAQFPLFGRVVPSNDGEAAAALTFFRGVAKSSHVAILFVADAFGSALEKAFTDQAWDYQIETVSFALPFDPSQEQVETVMEQLKASDIRHVYAICYESQVEQWVPVAEQVGLTKSTLWLFPGLNLESFSGNPALQSAIPEGSFLVTIEAVVPLTSRSPALQNGEIPPKKPVIAEQTSEYDNFLTRWTEAKSNPEFMTYFRSKLPINFETISEEPTALTPFIYDAVFALGQSICWNETLEFPTGEDIFQAFKGLDTQGASGRIQILSETGSRDYNTVQFVMWNVRKPQDAAPLFVPSHYLRNSAWVPNGNNTAVFSDGSSTVPASVIPVDMDSHYIGTATRAVSYGFAGLAILCSLVSLGWTVWNRRKLVVRVSGTTFLTLTSIGTLLMATSIFPLSMDETTTTSATGRNVACMSWPWLYMIGYSLLFGALFAKANALHSAFLEPEIKALPLSWKSYAGSVSAVLCANAIILSTWTIISPLEWNRTVTDKTDRFGRPTESYGDCSSDHATIFVSIMVVLNGIGLIVANSLNVRSRNVFTEYNESYYVAVCLATLLQILVVSISIVVVVNDSPQAFFAVMFAIIFVSALPSLLLIYIPKVKALQENSPRTTPSKPSDSFISREFSS